MAANSIQPSKKDKRKILESYQYLSKTFSYNEETGDLIWIGHFATGSKAGTLVKKRGYQSPYIKVTINRLDFKAHRLAWCLYHKQDIPENHVIDHINGDSTDNSIVNLRLATCHQNSMNSVIPKCSTTGVKGVCKSGRKFRAYINHKFKQIHLGSFESIEEAKEAYNKAALKLYGEFARLNP